MFADEIRRAIEAADRITLPSVTALLWRAYADGKITEAEAEALSGSIEARTATAPRRRENPSREGLTGESQSSQSQAHPPQDHQSAPRRSSVGSRPRTGASLERRRRWAASGRLPPALAARFTLAEQAVLALVATETARRGDCRLAYEHVAALAGVSRSTVKNAMREARRLGLVTVEERRVAAFRNDTNVVRIVSREWLAWLQLARRGDIPKTGATGRHPAREGGGDKTSPSTTTAIPKPMSFGSPDGSQGYRKTMNDRSRS